MISVDCKEVLPIKHELLVHVADDLGAFPALKQNEFVLTPVEPEEIIDSHKVTDSIKFYLNSIGEGKNFEIICKSDKVEIKSINGKKINRVTPPVKTIGTCCGL